MSPVGNKVHINVDLAEGYGNWVCGPDKELLPLIDHANVACGFHASDPIIMMETVENCQRHNIKIGAHVGLPDLQGFGRRELKLSMEEHTANTIYQIGALQGFLNFHGVQMHHVKPHGMLYAMMCQDYDVARAVMLGIPKGVPVFGLPGSNMEKAAHDLGIAFWAELFADVKYTSVGSLIIERKKRAWLSSDVRKHVSEQIETSSVTSIDGISVPLSVKDYPVTICCHSDVPGCLDVVKETRAVVNQFNKKMGY